MSQREKTNNINNLFFYFRNVALREGKYEVLINESESQESRASVSVQLLFFMFNSSIQFFNCLLSNPVKTTLLCIF